MKMSYQTICSKNKFGFCKFGNLCRMKHLEKLCDSENCEIVNCEMRNPKDCYFYNFYGSCKFGEYCRYHHRAIENNSIVKGIRESEVKKI